MILRIGETIQMKRLGLIHKNETDGRSISSINGKTKSKSSAFFERSLQNLYKHY